MQTTWAPARPFSGWRIVVFASIASGLTGPGQTIGVSVFVDPIERGLGLSSETVATCYLIGTLCGSLAMPTVGRWVDRVGVRRAMTAVGVAFSFALAAMAGVQGVVTLALGFTGIRMLGQGSLSLISTVAVSHWFERRRGLALGITATAGSALLALVPVGSSLAISEFGWRVAWLVAAGVIAVTVIPIGRFAMIDRPADVGQVPDGDDADEHQARAAAATTSLDRSQALRTKRFWILASASATAAMLVTALNFHQVKLLGESGFSETEAAAMFLPQVLGAAIAGIAMGWAIDRFGTRLAPAAASVVLVVALVLAGSASALPLVFVYAVVLGITGGAMRTTSTTLLPAWFGLGHIGAIQGALSFVGVAASATGPLLLATTASVTGDYRSAALVWALFPLAVAIWATTNRLDDPAAPVSRHT